MFGVWLHAPCQCGAFCCGKASRRRRKCCFVLRRSHVLAACICTCILLFLVQLGSGASFERWLAGSWSAARVQDVQDALSEQSIDQQQAAATTAPATVAPVTVAPSWRPLPLDWQKTQLGPGFPNEIDSAWSDVGLLQSGDVLRVEADGFNSKDSPIAVWGWYLNVWNGDGRHWVTKKGSSEPSRLLHFNPRPRGGGYIAINIFLKGSGWGKEKDVPIPEPWKMENAHKAFVLDLELSDQAWLVTLNGKQRPEMSYKRAGDFSGPLVVQLYDFINPRVALKKLSWS